MRRATRRARALDFVRTRGVSEGSACAHLRYPRGEEEEEEEGQRPRSQYVSLRAGLRTALVSKRLRSRSVASSVETAQGSGFGRESHRSGLSE